MKVVVFVMVIFTSHLFTSQGQVCQGGQEVLNALRQVQKLLSAHETSFTQSLRSLRKKLGLLQNSTVKHSSTVSACPPPEPLANGRILGRVFRAGHEVHFLCRPGFQLTGPETRVCLGSQTWSGAQPSCKNIDECELFRRTAPGRLCLHTCVNTAGSFQCQCPAGYSLGRDSRSCHDIDECARASHNCSGAQVCVNTYGGHRCEQVDCPRFLNATYIKTSPLRCDRNPCVQGDSACLQAPVSINFHFLSVVSNMTAPTVLFRLSASRVVGDALRFGLLGRRGVQHFSVQRAGRQTGQLVLVNPVQGPATLQVDIEMSEMERKLLLGRYVTKVTLFVSPYSF